MKARFTIPVGGRVVCGSRSLLLDSVDANNVATLTLTLLKGETFETKDPRQRDSAWRLDDPGEGEMVEQQVFATVGHKIRVGNHRQFRIVSFDGTHAQVVVVGPDQEVS